jgi:hypothetical protein
MAQDLHSSAQTPAGSLRSWRVVKHGPELSTQYRRPNFTVQNKSPMQRRTVLYIA